MALLVALTLLLGVLTAFSFYVVGGPLALRGPDALFRLWWLIYPVEAAVAGGVMVIVGWMVRDRVGRLSLVALVLAAWIGELLILASGQIDDDIVGAEAIGYWLMATGGPLQPIAAIVGGLAGRRLASRQRRLPADG